ncbi:MAG: acylphosphatase [Anaerolineae bacterium]|nr:acylphosphatase [Anaerolineae bacterium]
MNYQLHAVVQGRVQGVSFRHYTVMQAQDLGLAGWVRNRPDGSVETTAEGEKEQLDIFLDWLHIGSPAAQVTQVTVHWYPATGTFSSFETRYGYG